MVIKVVYAIVVGFVLDFVLRGVLPKSLCGGYTGHADEVDCHEEHSDEELSLIHICVCAVVLCAELFAAGALSAYAAQEQPLPDSGMTLDTAELTLDITEGDPAPVEIGRAHV